MPPDTFVAIWAVHSGTLLSEFGLTDADLERAISKGYVVRYLTVGGEWRCVLTPKAIPHLRDACRAAAKQLVICSLGGLPSRL